MSSLTFFFKSVIWRYVSLYMCVSKYLWLLFGLPIKRHKTPIEITLSFTYIFLSLLKVLSLSDLKNCINWRKMTRWQRDLHFMPKTSQLCEHACKLKIKWWSTKLYLGTLYFITLKPKKCQNISLCASVTKSCIILQWVERKN